MFRRVFLFIPLFRPVRPGLALPLAAALAWCMACLSGGALADAPPPVPLQPGKPVDYEKLAFQPQSWRDRGLDFTMVPWHGKEVVFLTKPGDCDGLLMARWMQRLDGGWRLYADLTGRRPHPHKTLDGKPVIAAIPGPELSCGVGCGFVGATGVELGKFYQDDYPKLVERPDSMPHYVFYEMGRNFFTFGDRHSCFTTGFAVFMRYVCMDALGCLDEEEAVRKTIEGLEPGLGKSGLDFLNLFTMAGGTGEKKARVRDAGGGLIHPSDQPCCYTAAMLRLRRENGGDAWVKRFFHELAACPESPPHTRAGAQAQCWNWLLCASVAARRNLAPVFRNDWGMPLTEETAAALDAVDWKKDGLRAAELAAEISAGWRE